MSKRVIFVTGSVMALTVLMALPTFAATQPMNGRQGWSTSSTNMHKPAPGVGGKITAINGSILTVTGRNNTTYTVDATNATITKSGTASQLSAIAVGDNIMARGTLSGTNLTATSIMDGVPAKVGEKEQPGQEVRGGMRGNGAFGTVTGINGSSFTTGV